MCKLELSPEALIILWNHLALRVGFPRALCQDRRGRVGGHLLLLLLLFSTFCTRRVPPSNPDSRGTEFFGMKIRCKNRKLRYGAFMLVAQKFQHIKDTAIGISVLFLVRPNVDLQGVSRWWNMLEVVAFIPPSFFLPFFFFLKLAGMKRVHSLYSKNGLHEVFLRQTMTNEHIESWDCCSQT